MKCLVMIPVFLLASAPSIAWAASDGIFLAQAMFLDLWKFGFVTAFFYAWSGTCTWVNDDAKALKLDVTVWNSAVVFGGLVGLLALFVSESYVLGVVLFMLLFLAPTLSYVFAIRNPTVPDNAKVLTPEHLYYLLCVALAKVGIKLAIGDEGETVDGPPIRFIGKSSTGRTEDHSRVRNVEGSRGYTGARELVYDAIVRRATDIHLEPTPDELLVRYRIDGILHASEPFDRGTGDAIINVFKVLSAMDITEKRKPQDGSFGAEMGNRKIDFRVATSGSATGEKMVIRILDASGSLMRLSRLGMSKRLVSKIHAIATQPYGLFLVSGPTGSGKSTTLYACLQEIDRFTKNVITVEDPVEYHLDSITQIEINKKMGKTFATELRSILRQDPDVILVGEIRDKETADIACQAAQTGHMVFSTVHANDSISTVNRLLDLGVDAGNLGTSLSGVLAQRLVRVLCPDCKQPYRPKPEVLRKANLHNKGIDVLYRPPTNYEQPCPTCGGTGYRGRCGVFEYLMVTDKMKDMIRDRANLRDFKAEARRSGTEYLQEYGLKLVAQGKTSIQELMRVVR